MQIMAEDHLHASELCELWLSVIESIVAPEFNDFYPTGTLQQKLILQNNKLDSNKIKSSKIFNS
jgi:hypothetical protein